MSKAIASKRRMNALKKLLPKATAGLEDAADNDDLPSLSAMLRALKNYLPFATDEQREVIIDSIQKLTEEKKEEKE